MFIDSGCALGDSCRCNGDDGRCSNPIGVKVATGGGFHGKHIQVWSSNPAGTHSNETARKREAASEVRLVDVSMNSLDHQPVGKLMMVKSVLKHRPM